MLALKKSIYRLRHTFRAKAIILMYHKIGSPVYDPWDLSVRAENFEQQLAVLKNFTVLPVAEIADQISKKKIKHNCIGLTFDDGYLDNYETAWPLLKHFDLPATIFVTTKNIGTTKEFWWDELEFILFHNDNLPKNLDLKFNSHYFSFDLGEESQLSEPIIQKQKKYKADKITSFRTELYFKLWQFLSKLLCEEQEQVMTQLRQWAGTNVSARKLNICMNEKHLKNIATDQRITLGGHTSNHPALSYLTPDRQTQEIVANKLFLNDLIRKPIELFAYPSGNYNGTAIECVQNEGFKAAFTTNHKTNTTSTNKYLINRFQVNDWDDVLFYEKLKQWSHF